jgi:hypothetical protein
MGAIYTSTSFVRKFSVKFDIIEKIGENYAAHRFPHNLRNCYRRS